MCKNKRLPLTARDDPSNSPTAWFAVLDRARQTQDHELAARALGELRRLGVRVKFQPDRRKGAGDA